MEKCPSLSDFIPTLEFKSGHDVHGLQLLYEELAPVRHLDIADVAGALAVLTVAGVAQQTASRTHLYLELVRAEKYRG